MIWRLCARGEGDEAMAAIAEMEAGWRAAVIGAGAGSLP